MGAITENAAKNTDAHSDAETVTSQNSGGNHDGSGFLSRPYWLTDEGLKKGEIEVLSLQEEQFWKDLLDMYLYPIDEDKDEKVRDLNSNVATRSFHIYLLEFKKEFFFIFHSKV